MTVGIVLLCLFSVSICLRIFTVEILGKKMHMDNAFTRTVLFDVPALQKRATGKSANIDKKTKSKSLLTIKKNQSNKKRLIDNFKQTKQDMLTEVNKIRKLISNYATEWLILRIKYIELANLYNKLIAWNVPLLGEYGLNSVVEIEDNHLTTFEIKQDTKYNSFATVEFAKYCEDKGISFLYVAAPKKIARTDTKYNGGLDFTNQNTDEFLSFLKKHNVRFIDLRSFFETQTKKLYDFFYRTDHHWKAETGLWVAQIIASYLNKEKLIHSDLSLLNASRYEQHVYKRWFLGSYGRKVTLTKAEPEDFTVLKPKFPVKIHYVIPNIKIDKIGGFDITYNAKCLVKDYYNTDTYETYNYSQRPYMYAENLLSTTQKKALIIKDSFGNVVAPFLYTQFRYTEVVDLRYGFKGSIKKLIDSSKPNIVIVLYHNGPVGLNGEKYKRYKFN